MSVAVSPMEMDYDVGLCPKNVVVMQGVEFCEV